MQEKKFWKNWMENIFNSRVSLREHEVLFPRCARSGRLIYGQVAVIFSLKQTNLKVRFSVFLCVFLGCRERR